MANRSRDRPFDSGDNEDTEIAKKNVRVDEVEGFDVIFGVMGAQTYRHSWSVCVHTITCPEI